MWSVKEWHSKQTHDIGASGYEQVHNERVVDHGQDLDLRLDVIHLLQADDL